MVFLDKTHLVNRDKCILTEADDLELVSSLHNFPIHMSCVEQDRCEDLHADLNIFISKSTGSIQVNPLVPVNTLYDQSHGGGDVGTVWNEYHRLFAEFISQDRPKKILEIGGGHGILSSKYEQYVKGCEWIILEPSPRPVDGSKCRYIQGYAENIHRSHLMLL